MTPDRNRLPPGFVRRSTVIAPGGEHPFREAEWEGAIVTVARGEVDLCCRRGGRVRFVRGDVLWMEGLGLVALRNPGDEDAVLVAVARAA